MRVLGVVFVSSASWISVVFPGSLKTLGRHGVGVFLLFAILLPLSKLTPIWHGFLSVQKTMEETYWIVAQPHSGFSPAVLHLPMPQRSLQPHRPQTLATCRLRPGGKPWALLAQPYPPNPHQHVPRPAFFLANLSSLSSSCSHFLNWKVVWEAMSWVAGRTEWVFLFVTHVELMICDERRKRRTRRKRRKIRVEGVWCQRPKMGCIRGRPSLAVTKPRLHEKRWARISDQSPLWVTVKVYHFSCGPSEVITG